jgi:hypothetical protein
MWVWRIVGEMPARQSRAATRELRGTMAVGEKADVTDAVEAVGHGVLEEAANELVGGQRHHLDLCVMAIVPPGETDLTVIECHEAAVGDGHTMGVASEITEHLFRPGKWRFGEDHPVDAGQFIEPSGERGVISQVCECAGQAKLTRGDGGAQLADERVAEATGEHAHRQEEAGAASDPACLVGRDAATRDDAVQVRMMVQRLAPGVQDRDGADLGAKVVRVGADAAQRLRCSAE